MSERRDLEAEKREAVLHEVDGIKEYDNDLPRWWLWVFYGTIGFAAVYWYQYEVTKFADSPGKAYQADMDRIASEQAAKNPVTAESLAALAKDDKKVAQGKEIYAQNCASCHRADGGGNVGPNLTDSHWIYGGAPMSIYTTVNKGQAEKGMPAWGPPLGLARVQAVTAYVLSIKGTNAPGGKPPQGTEEVTQR
ncbi:MAG: c-type cytochrome [Myxococcales bacterium]|jgi:cytochrome c oxidase cbb3-type subunit 3|nr:c-type cytochrome [Myxococcales bacterium]